MSDLLWQDVVARIDSMNEVHADILESIQKFAQGPQWMVSMPGAQRDKWWISSAAYLPASGTQALRP